MVQVMLRVSGDLDTHIKFYHEVRHVTHLHTLHACLHVHLLDLFLNHVSCVLCTGLHVTTDYRSHPYSHIHTLVRFPACMRHCTAYLSADSSSVWVDSLTHTKSCHVQVLGMRLIRKAHLAPGHHECAYMSYKPSERDGTWIELLLSDPSKVSV